MTKASTSRPPRLVPDQPFPPYAYIPGRTAHPTRDPDGHSYGATLETPEPPDPTAWRECRNYLYGIDLFNHGFYWESHEAWEGLWAACGRRGPTATFLQALINLAAAGFKARWGSARGMRANAETAHQLFRAFERDPAVATKRYMGLDVRALADFTQKIVHTQASTTIASGTEALPTFDLILRPD